ncbi:hypothetical protein FACS1894145_1290 [Bacteroidia bacterium]|nr:hypothetical protein FACS1894145_1290 [Bacteroidia bacterium]
MEPGEEITGASTVSTTFGAIGISAYIETFGPTAIWLDVQAVIIIKTTDTKIVNLVFIILRELDIKHILRLC